MSDFEELWPRGAGPRRFYPTFTGSASEYFRIWSVNSLLTLLTLGVYLAWAKVRKRRYFYWNTYLDGVPFDYLARPGAILAGHLALAGALAAAKFSDYLSSAVGGAVSLVLYGLVPWLVYKAHRFRARNSSYRGVRFRFSGTIGGAYRVYGLLPGIYLAVVALFFVLTMLGGFEPNVEVIGFASLPVGFTAILVYPYWMYLRRRYTFSNIAFGSATAVFRGEPRYFYRVYLTALGIGFLGAMAIFFGIFLLAASLGPTGFSAEAAPVLAPLGFLAVASVWFIFDQYVYAKITNHCWNNLKLGPLSFEVSLDPGKLIWLRISNTAATVATLGLAAPWAEIRRMKYLVECFCVVAPQGFDAVSQAEDSTETALGDTAVDFIDLDVGW